MFVFSKFSSPRGNTFVASLGPKGNEGRKGKKKGEGRGREGKRGAGNHRQASCQIVVDLFPLLTPRFPSGSVAGSQVPREKSMAEGPSSRQIMEKGNDLSV